MSADRDTGPGRVIASWARACPRCDGWIWLGARIEEIDGDLCCMRCAVKAAPSREARTALLAAP